MEEIEDVSTLDDTLEDVSVKEDLNEKKIEYDFIYDKDKLFSMYDFKFDNKLNTVLV